MRVVLSVLFVIFVVFAVLCVVARADVGWGAVCYCSDLFPRRWLQLLWAGARGEAAPSSGFVWSASQGSP